VPDEWYRRSTKGGPRAAGPSEYTIRRLAALHESQEEDDDECDNCEGDGTAKMGNLNTSSSAKTVEQRGLVTQGRLSGIFDGWLKPTSPTPSPRTSAVILSENRKSVSEPRLVNQVITNNFVRNSLSGSDTSDGENEDGFDNAFEEMLVSPQFQTKALLISYCHHNIIRMI